jgi:hypothetical protein
MDGYHDEELRAEYLFQRRKEERDEGGKARDCDCFVCNPRTDREAKVAGNLSILSERFLESLRRPN